MKLDMVGVGDIDNVDSFCRVIYVIEDCIFIHEDPVQFTFVTLIMKVWLFKRVAADLLNFEKQPCSVFFQLLEKKLNRFQRD